MIVRSLFWSCCIASLVLGSTAAASTPPAYHITAEFDDETKSLTAQQSVTYTHGADAPVSSLYFHVYPNREYSRHDWQFIQKYAGYFKINPFPDGFQNADFQVSRVRSEDRELTFSIEGNDKSILRVDLPESLAKNEAVTIAMDFSMTVPHSYGRFGWHGDIVALARWYPVLSVFEEGEWVNHPFYIFHRPFYSEAASYQVTMTVPATHTLIHSGVKVREDQQGERKTLSLRSEKPIRDFAMTLSPSYAMVSGEVDGVLIRSYYLPGREARAREALASAKGMMEEYGRRFASYPYSEFNIAPMHLGYGGEQMSNVIFIDTRVYALPKYLNRHFDFLIAHETGHQWFYNLVGFDDYAEMWLEEGVHSHFLLDYLEKKYGENAEVLDWNHLPDALQPFLPELTFRGSRDIRHKVVARIGLDRPVVEELSDFEEPSSIFSVVYGKGAKVTAMLENVVGREALNKVFRRVFTEYAHQNLSVQELKRMLEEEYGGSLDWFFDPWLFQTAHLDYSIEGVKGSTITVRNHGTAVMPVDIQVTSDTGQQTIRWDGSVGESHIEVPGVKKIQRVEIDPREDLLDQDRTNNAWPRRVNWHMVPLYHGLWDVPGLLPDDGYNVVAGPAMVSSGLGLKASFQKPYSYLTYAASGYDWGQEHWHSQAGAELRYLWNSPTALGFEVTNTNDMDDDDEDLLSGKMYLRRELWPVPYSLTSVSDHVSLYLIRNAPLNPTLYQGGAEDDRNMSYLENHESIVGTSLTISRMQPLLDPLSGYRVTWNVENAGHFLGGRQTYTRSMVDGAYYHPVTPLSVLAVRGKYGWSDSEDKNLYELGGMDGLRGYDRKTVRGAQALLGSVEYRFPIIRDRQWDFVDNTFTITGISGVIFLDAGHSWYDDYSDGDWKADAGVGLRAPVAIASFLEQTMLRLDVAHAIDEPDASTRVWFGVNQAF